MRYLLTFLALVVLNTTPFAAYADVLRPIETQVGSVIDGDTFITREGQHIRLLGINTPEKKRDANPAEEGAYAATEYAKKILPKGKNVTLKFDENDHDRYGRLLAHVYLDDGTWVNKQMVEEGYAHVYTFPDNRSHIDELLNAETQARRAGKGLWQQRRWQILEAVPVPDKYQAGKFQLVKGTPIKAAKVKGVIYLNYGDDWRTDFTIEIPPAAQKLFKAEGVEPLIAFIDKPIIVRGHLKPVNGMLIRVTHPEQIQPASAE